MAFPKRFSEYQAATAYYGLQRSPIRNEVSSANRKLVQELANRPSVIEALKEERSIPGRCERKQDRVNGGIKSRLGFKNEHRVSVHDRLGYVKRPIYHRRHFRSGVSSLMRDGSGSRNEHHNLSVHDRLGYVKKRRMFHRRHSRSGVSPLIRDQSESEESDFEKELQLNQTHNFCDQGNFDEKWQLSSDDIYVEVDNNGSESKIDMDDVHFKVECSSNHPRAHPSGIFEFHQGIRYYGSEIFIWITESDPIDQF